MTVFARILQPCSKTTWTPSQLVSRRLPCTPTSSDPDTWALRDMAFLLSTVLVSGNAAVEVMHGAGTTNPSKLFWNAMELMSERSRLPLHLTYRAVGSSTGQKEFLGDTNGYKSLNDFGSGDIPMTKSRYDSLVASGRQMVHVPFALGGIGVFHSVPTSSPLDLTGCLLARIFKREITSWDHADIRALNPKLSFSGPIKVVHRVQGSSSTAGFTEYLAQKCPESWDLGSGSTITWPEGTFEAQGSGGMATFIADSANVGAIGYIDAGHGHSAKLSEVALQNKDGTYLTTTSADIGAAGALALAAKPSIIPTDASSDFSGVHLYDLEGPTTWPITMISYIYLDKNMTAMDDVTCGLLMYFVNFILSEEGQALAEANLFVKLPKELLDYNAVTLSSLLTPPTMPTFTTELASKTLAQVGAGQYVISGKRRSFGEYRGTSNAKAIEVLTDPSSGSLATMLSHEPVALAGLVIASLAFVLAAVAAVVAVVLCCRVNRSSTPRSAANHIEVKALESPMAAANEAI